MTDIVQLARQLDTSHRLLMDIMEGRQELTFELADAMAEKFGSSAEWLLGESGQSFQLVDIGSVGYREFFFPDESKDDYTFKFLRIGGSRHYGTLFILRQNVQIKRVTPAVIEQSFYLGSGMWGGRYVNLKRFLLLLKTEAARLSINTFDLTPGHPNFEFSTVIGQQHNVYFQDSPHHSSARWLQQVFNGEGPGDWFSNGWSSVLREIGVTPFNDDSNLQAEWLQNEFRFNEAFAVRAALFWTDTCGWSGNE